jgi:hypothetical protein
MAAIAKFPQEFGSRLWMQSRRECGATFPPRAAEF